MPWFCCSHPVLLVAIATLGVRRRYVTAIGLAVAGLVSVVSLSAFMPEPVHSFDHSAYYETQQCETSDAVAYCFSPLYQDRVERWEETVGGVDDLVPIEVDWVVQRTPWFNSSDDWVNQVDANVARASYRWDRPGAVPSRALGLGLEVAQPTVGLPTTQGELDRCRTDGQARAVVSVWLAAASLEHGEEALDRAIEAYSYDTFQPVDLSHGSGAQIFTADAHLARDLLKLPTSRVHDTLVSWWEEVVDPSTSSVELAGWFDMPAPTLPTNDLGMEPCE